MKLGPDNRALMMIGGEMVESESGNWLETVNPANEDVIGHVPDGTAADINRAVAAGMDAWPGWAAMPVNERADKLRALANGLRARADEILEVEVRDTGNTITPMRHDVGMAASELEYYAGLCFELKGQTIPATPDNLHFTMLEPFGVVGRIAPFNHPMLFAAARTAAALMAGNAVVIKPPETSPLSASIYGEICREILPPGVVNIVTGTGGGAGDALVRHPDVKRIAFIGSANTGRAIQRAAAEVAVKHVTLELGGKNPMIVFPDADLDEALDAAILGMNFAWQGQSCGSTSRLMLHESIHDAFVEKLVARVSAFKLGDPMDPASEMGPVNSRGQLEKSLHYIKAAAEDGAELLTGGKQPDGDAFKKGFWVEPTVYGGVTMDNRLGCEEVFGPVLAILKWSDRDEAIEIANDVEYGLTAGIWTRDLDTAMYMIRRVRAGYTWINGRSAHYKATPFGGMKNSGVGREEGIEEMLSYTEAKTVHMTLR